MSQAPTAGPPPLRPFGLVLHYDGSWSHEGHPILNRRIRRAFDRGVRYLADEEKFVVQLGRFRGEIEVEESAFFVSEIDVGQGRLRLSDGSCEVLDVSSLSLSERDGALLCRIKVGLRAGGIPARFRHAAQAELLARVEPMGDAYGIRVLGQWSRLPDRVVV